MLNEIIEGQWLAWYIFGTEDGHHPVRVQFLGAMQDGGQQIRLESGLCIIIPKRMLDRFTEAAATQQTAADVSQLRPSEPITDGYTADSDLGASRSIARAASNALDALAFEQSKYGERWRSPDEPHPRD